MDLWFRCIIKSVSDLNALGPRNSENQPCGLLMIFVGIGWRGHCRTKNKILLDSRSDGKDRASVRRHYSSAVIPSSVARFIFLYDYNHGTCHFLYDETSRPFHHYLASHLNDKRQIWRQFGFPNLGCIVLRIQNLRLLCPTNLVDVRG